ncbi:uncharacterized protein LOC108916017 [Anoplophora glabripennis]|uniref:uncharacterized protein LOC108916017 n=1 Tax=Anoplophora glabripennis TaxID=217634 RepID=UPI000874E9F2|nr:uncharacterized protein LOC108916017 [Anoplophora glabripennis]
MNANEYVMLSPIEDFFYLVTNVVRGEPTVEDLILLLGTLVAFIAFILWSCFPVHHKDALLPVLQGPDKSGKDEEKYNQISSDYDLDEM